MNMVGCEIDGVAKKVFWTRNAWHLYTNNRRLALKCLMHSQSRKGFLWRQYIVKLYLEKISLSFVNGIPVLLAKPLTYMNLSGESTGPLAAYYKLPLNRVVVFHDDMDLPCGVLRLHPKGGHHRHNGLMLHYGKEHMHWSKSYLKGFPKVVYASIRCRSTST